MEYRDLGPDEIPEDGDQIRMTIGRHNVLWVGVFQDPQNKSPVSAYGGGTRFRRPLPPETP